MNPYDFSKFSKDDELAKIQAAFPIGSSVSYSADIYAVVGFEQSRGKVLAILKSPTRQIKVLARTLEPAKATFAPPDWSMKGPRSSEEQLKASYRRTSSK